jgi:hypothetical protein
LVFEIFVESIYLPEAVATQSLGLPLRQLWVRKSIIHNRKAVASAGRNPYRVDYLEPLLPRVEATLGCETLPLRGIGIRPVAPKI